MLDEKKKFKQKYEWGLRRLYLNGFVEIKFYTEMCIWC